MKTELLELAEDSVTLPPLAVTLPLCVCVLPMVTLPKLNEPGVTPSVPVVLLAEPLRATVTEGSAAVDAMARLAVSVPELVGEKVTARFVLAPAASEYGSAGPLTANPLPVTLADEIVRLDPPVFETVSVWLWLLPVETLPKLRLAEVLRYPAPAPVPDKAPLELPRCPVRIPHAVP